jgi:hypothetical protein
VALPVHLVIKSNLRIEVLVEKRLELMFLGKKSIANWNWNLI